jgi:hypothetical protein
MYPLMPMLTKQNSTISQSNKVSLNIASLYITMVYYLERSVKSLVLVTTAIGTLMIAYELNSIRHIMYNAFMERVYSQKVGTPTNIS